MKTIPILFSTEMVQAILAGNKTQTRRIVKKKYSNTDIGWKDDKYGRRLVERQNDVPPPVKNPDGSVTHHLTAISEVSNPYGQPGDILWVRETFYAYGWWRTEGKKKRFIDFTPEDQGGQYRYMENPPETILKGQTQNMGWYKRVSIHMPKAACRLFLKIKSIRVERLQDISETDAVAEGIRAFTKDKTVYKYSHSDSDVWKDMPRTAVEAYRRLWQKINGPESWDANPYVWVIEFEKTERPPGFLL